MFAICIKFGSISVTPMKIPRDWICRWSCKNWERKDQFFPSLMEPLILAQMISLSSYFGPKFFVKILGI